MFDDDMRETPPRMIYSWGYKQYDPETGKTIKHRDKPLVYSWPDSAIAGTAIATGALALWLGYRARKYVKRKDWTRAIVSGGLCCGASAVCAYLVIYLMFWGGRNYD